MRMMRHLCAYLFTSTPMPTAAEQTERRQTIRRLLSDAPAETQQSLVDALVELGIVATQSSVSRDLRELGAIKTPRGYELPQEEASNDDEFAGVAELLRDMQPAGPNLLVIRTGTGAAQRVALALDRCAWPEMVGNIGGDDTVFVATESAAKQKQLITRIERAVSRA